MIYVPFINVFLDRLIIGAGRAKKCYMISKRQSRPPGKVSDVMWNECVDRLEWTHIHLAAIHTDIDCLLYCLKNIVGLESNFRPLRIRMIIIRSY